MSLTFGMLSALATIAAAWAPGPALAPSPPLATAARPPTAAGAVADLEYALPAPELPCVAAPCGGAQLEDFRLELGEPGGPRAGEARVRLEERLYLGLRADEASRALSIAAARWNLELEHRDDRAGLELEVRGRRLRVATRAVDHRLAAGDGWQFDAEAALRLGPDLELLAAATADDRSEFTGEPSLRPTSSVSLGALWQRGARLEIGGRLVAATVETPAGLELDRRGLETSALYQANRWRLEGDLELTDLSGRFERRESAAAARFTYRITAHLVAAAAARERRDADLGALASGTELEIGYYARRFRFARAGEAGWRSVELARRAGELGFNERRAHDLEGRRRLRQRLEVSGARDELAALIEDLYRAQLAERNVPLAGVAWRQGRDDVNGERRRETEVFLAVPWPRRDGPPPLRHDEAATDFLRFGYTRVERDISRGFTTEGSTLAVDVSLRREIALRFVWDDPAASGLEFALRTQQPRQFTASLLYRRGI